MILVLGWIFIEKSSGKFIQSANCTRGKAKKAEIIQYKPLATEPKRKKK